MTSNLEDRASCRGAKRTGLSAKIDVLFIDTSHEFQHTLDEIGAWSGHLADDGVMIFHDTNMGNGTYARLDGSIDFGWDNDRGVIRAIEEFVGRTYDERAYFTDRVHSHLISHAPHCNGFTIIKRIKSS